MCTRVLSFRVELTALSLSLPLSSARSLAPSRSQSHRRTWLDRGKMSALVHVGATPGIIIYILFGSIDPNNIYIIMPGVAPTWTSALILPLSSQVRRCDWEREGARERALERGRESERAVNSTRKLSTRVHTHPLAPHASVCGIHRVHTGILCRALTREGRVSCTGLLHSI